MARIFGVRGTDKRSELIASVRSNDLFVSQKPSGKDVEYFNPDVGFILLEKEGYLNTNKAYVQRAAACAELSLGPKLELRETITGFSLGVLSGNARTGLLHFPALLPSGFFLL